MHFQSSFALRVLSALVLVSSATLADAQAKSQSAMSAAPAIEQAYGFYSHGSLANPTELPPQGPGFIHLFEGLNRYWGTQDMVRLLTSAAKRMSERYPDGERLQIGDIAARSGGEISGHGSHQNGLDADVVYYRVNHTEQSPLASREDFTEPFVRQGRVTPNLDLERSWEIIKLLDETHRVGRIFVHPAIKAALCRQAQKLGEATEYASLLRRLRPHDGHDDHFHVRLRCPEGTTQCEKQFDVPNGPTGCPAPSAGASRPR
jgi:penicillin-insensitive murein endopeptidase